ncbi:MAG TPA: hypothetical protein VIM59_12635 [Cellvibrio sp.]
MRKRMAIIALLVCGICNLTYAQGPGWSSVTKIKRIIVVSNGGVNVSLQSDLQGCTPLSGYGARYASLYPDHPGADRIYSLLIAAYLSQQDVQIYLSDNTCRIGEVVIGGNFSY